MNFHLVPLCRRKRKSLDSQNLQNNLHPEARLRKSMTKSISKSYVHTALRGYGSRLYCSVICAEGTKWDHLHSLPRASSRRLLSASDTHELLLCAEAEMTASAQRTWAFHWCLWQLIYLFIFSNSVNKNTDFPFFVVFFLMWHLNWGLGLTVSHGALLSDWNPAASKLWFGNVLFFTQKEGLRVAIYSTRKVSCLSTLLQK